MTNKEYNKLYLSLLEKFKVVVRDKKRVKKLDCKPGYKAVDGRCIKMSGAEKLSRQKAGKKSAKKRKSKQSSITKKTNKSLAKRKSVGL